MIYRLAVPGPIEDVEELRVLEWHGEPGTRFEAGALVVELETHKAVVEVRASRPGVLRAILCPAGDWQKVGRTLALVGDDDAEPLPADDAALAALDVAFEVT
jgi:pyruvate/2-oxoglutarate dehydrogenase complex dihydrolipoamide acyltransferase (E2) component